MRLARAEAIGCTSPSSLYSLAPNLNPNPNPNPQSQSQSLSRGTKRRPIEPAKPISFRGPIGSGTGCRQSVNAQGMEEEEAERSEIRQRMPLAEVVADCVKRWFQDALKEAKNGDTSMQVLVGQMYYSGYGIPRDVKKGRAWISKASRSRSSVWKLGNKHPGYNASDSDSDDQMVDAQ